MFQFDPRPVWLCLAMVACGKSDDSGASLTGTAPIPGTGQTDTAATTPSSTGEDGCPYTGEWELTSLVCDGTDVTADHFALVTSTTMSVVDSPSGRCFVEVTYTTTYCEEREDYEALLATGDTWGITAFGITSCNPKACTFDEDDMACAIGDRSGTWIEGTTWDLDSLTVVRQDALSLCASYGATDAVFQWARQVE